MTKILFTCLLSLFVIVAFSQTTVTGDRVVARQSLYVRDRWVDSVLNDTAFMGKVRSVPTADAVRRFVEGRIATISYPVPTLARVLNAGSIATSALGSVYLYPHFFSLEANAGQIQVKAPTLTNQPVANLSISSGNGTLEVSDTLGNRTQYQAGQIINNYLHRFRFKSGNNVIDTLANLSDIRNNITVETDPTSVHLTGNQTVAGIKTFSDQLFWKGGTSSTYGGLVTQPYFSNTHGAVVLYGSENSYNGSLMTGGLSGNRTYYLPDATGTIALQEWVTSRGYLTNYSETDPTAVKLTGDQSIDGQKTFNNKLWASTIHVYGDINSVGEIYMRANSNLYNTGYVNSKYLSAKGTNTTYSGIFTPATLTAERTYTFPNKDGTVAMLSDITGGGGTPAGANTQIQFNNSGAFGATQNLIFEASSGQLRINDSSQITNQGVVAAYLNNGLVNGNGFDLTNTYAGTGGTSNFNFYYTGTGVKTSRVRTAGSGEMILSAGSDLFLGYSDFVANSSINFGSYSAGAYGMQYDGVNRVFAIGGTTNSAYKLNVVGNSKVSGTTGLGNISADPTGAANGDLYYNSTTNKAKIYTNGAFQNLATENVVFNQIQTGNIIYVDKNNPNSTDSRTGLNKYSLVAPFLTIQAAVNVVDWSAGDIIYIRPGNYTENVSFGTGSCSMMRVILDNANIEGGAGSAFTFSGGGCGSISFYLINATIHNTGSGSDVSGTAAIQGYFRDLKIYGNSKDNCIISSENANGISFQPYGPSGLYADRISVKSTNSTGLNTYNAVGSLTNSYVYSGAGSAFLNQYVNIDQCVLEGYAAALNASAPSMQVTNSTIKSANGYGVYTPGMVSPMAGNPGLFKNCVFETYNKAFSLTSANSSLYFKVDLENNKFKILNPALTEAGEFSYATSSVWRFVNNISPIPLISAATRTASFANIKESNTQTSDSTVFFGINVGFGTQSPLSQVDINGANGYNQLRLRTQYTPTGTSDANGNAGDISVDNNYFYYKTSAGWKRTALSTF